MVAIVVAAVISAVATVVVAAVADSIPAEETGTNNYLNIKKASSDAFFYVCYLTNQT